jgi:hypothetical protein
MSYGIAINTTEGFVSLEDLRSAREVFRQPVTSRQAGSANLPTGVDASTSIVIAFGQFDDMLATINVSQNRVEWSVVGSFGVVDAILIVFEGVS